MKKIFLIIFFFCSSFLFADVFENGESILDSFWKSGDVIKIIKNKSNIHYINKTSIHFIEIDENDIQIIIVNGKDEVSKSYNISIWNINNDEQGNIVISRKLKK